MRMCSVETRAEIAVAPLVRLFTLLPGQFRAFCFRFVKVACVGQAAAGCQGLRLCLWEDADFWKAYSEPCNGELPAAPASGSWDGFRKWLFHLDGKWIDSFRNMALQVGADHTQLFADAHYIASGLSRHDNSDDVEDLVDIILRLLLDYDAGQADHHNAAKALVAVVSSRRDVFSLSHIHRIAAMYDESLEQAILDRQGPVVGPHFNDHSQWHVWTHGPPLRSCQWHVGHAWGDPQHAWSAVAWQQPQDTRSGNAPSYASPWKKDLGSAARFSEWHASTLGPPSRCSQWHVGNAWGDSQHVWSAIAWQQPQDTWSGNASSCATSWKKDPRSATSSSQWHAWTPGSSLRSSQWYAWHAWGQPQHAWSGIAWQLLQDTRCSNASSYVTSWMEDPGSAARSSQWRAWTPGPPLPAAEAVPTWHCSPLTAHSQ